MPLYTLWRGNETPPHRYNPQGEQGPVIEKGTDKPKRNQAGNRMRPLNAPTLFLD